MADYGLLGSFGSEASSALNADLITKLKEAEKEAILFNIDDKLENITGLDADTGDALDFLGESDTLTVIKAQMYDFLNSVSAFDLDSGETNSFDSVSASTTGSSAVFDAVDVGGLEPGTTNITVSQLAQKDVYQSTSFNEAIKDTQLTPIITAGTTPLDITTDVDGNPNNQAEYDEYLSYVANAGINVEVGDKSYFFNIVQDPTATTFEELGAKTMEQLATEINETDELVASIEQVGTDEYRLVIKSAEAGLDNAIKITQQDVNWGFDNETMKSDEIDSTSAFEDDYLIINNNIFTGNEVHSIAVSGTVDDGGSANGDATTVDFLGSSVATTQGANASELIDDILADKTNIINTWNTANTNNEIEDIIANPDGSDSLMVVFKYSEGDQTDGALGVMPTSTNNSVTFGDSTEVVNYEAGYTYASLISDIDTHTDFSASLINDNAGVGNIQISSDTSEELVIQEQNTDFNFVNGGDSHTQSAQNLLATIDGVDYNTASNTVTIQGNLTMTAVELGNATIDIQRDTTSVMTDLQTVLEGYNNLVDLINDEVSNPDTSISDTSTLRSMISGIKEIFFSSYGEDKDLNLFAFGLELDTQGHLSLDSTTFGEALVNNYDDIKAILLGNTTDEDLPETDSTKYLGLGLVLQDYLDNLDATDGLITRYENSISEKQADLEEEREEALEALDIKYNTLSAQFAQYAALISQMESSFSGLSLMIEQSVASN